MSAKRSPAASGLSPEPRHSGRSAPTWPPQPNTASTSSHHSPCSPNGNPGYPPPHDLTSYTRSTPTPSAWRPSSTEAGGRGPTRLLLDTCIVGKLPTGLAGPVGVELAKQSRFIGLPLTTRRVEGTM